MHTKNIHKRNVYQSSQEKKLCYFTEGLQYGNHTLAAMQTDRSHYHQLYRFHTYRFKKKSLAVNNSPNTIQTHRTKFFHLTHKYYNFSNNYSIPVKIHQGSTFRPIHKQIFKPHIHNTTLPRYADYRYNKITSLY